MNSYSPPRTTQSRHMRAWLYGALLCTVAGSLPVSVLGANAPLPPGSSLRFRHIGINDGLAQSSVQAIAQDRQGYIWIGTEDGLQRYDGYDFLTYRHDPTQSDSLADNDVAALAAGSDDRLWVGTLDQGLDLLEPGSRHFTHFRHDPATPSSLVSNTILALLVDKQGALWVGTDKGLDRMTANSGNFHHYVLAASNHNGNVVYALHQDASGRIWIGGRHGLYYYDKDADVLKPFKPTKGVDLREAQRLLSKTSVNAVADGSHQELLVATEDGIVILSSKGMVVAVYRPKQGHAGSLPNGRVRTILEDASGDIWIGTYGGGVARLNPASGRFFTYQHDATDPHSLAGNNILSMFQDQTGLVWIGTETTGISLYNPHTREFGYYRHRQGDSNSLASNVVWGIFKDRKGNVWVATDKGLTRMDASRLHYRQYEMGNRPKGAKDDATVYVVFGDRAGHIWAGTDYGLYEYVPAQDHFKRWRLTGKKGDPARAEVSTLYEDRAGRFWVGTAGGLAEFDRHSNRVTHWFTHDAKRADSLPDNGIATICETGGALWIGTNNGLAKFDGEHDSFKIYRRVVGNAHTLSANSIQSCTPAAGQGLWVGTVSGLNRLDTASGEVTRYSTRNGLPNNTIYAILPGRQGNIWVSTDNGLSHFDVTTGNFRNYADTDGLQGLEFNGGAAYAAPDGELFFGGVNGLNAFYPQNIRRNQQVPGVIITSILHAGHGQALPAARGQTQGITIPYSDNILGFDLAVLDYTAPNRNQFKYRLDGFDSVWHSLKGRHDLTYTNLDPGSYLLRVMGSNSDGVWSNQEATLAITVLPPAWRTWWAYLLYAALLFVVTVIGLRLFSHSVKREQILAGEHQKRLWAEALHNLIQSVMQLRDERAIAEQLVDMLVNFSGYDRALFYIESGQGFDLIASRGFASKDTAYLRRWPVEQSGIVKAIQAAKQVQLLSPADSATFGPNNQPSRRYLAVPLISGTGGCRLLFAGRTSPAIEQQALDIAAAMTKQVSVAMDNVRLIRDLENLATTDSLTRLHNRRHFLERAAAEFTRSRRYQRPLSVLLLDADNFKSVNDTYGHETGDKVLREIATACLNGLRQLDVAARYGGEEFIAFLPETSIASAMEVAERLRADIERIRIDAAGKSVEVTVSIGVATATAETSNLDALINEADRALYEAKRGGRNRVVLSQSDLDSDT